MTSDLCRDLRETGNDLRYVIRVEMARLSQDLRLLLWTMSMMYLTIAGSFLIAPLPLNLR